MLIPLSDLISKYRLKLNGVIHIGAHFSEEHEKYIEVGIRRFIYVEPCAKAFSVLRERFKDDKCVKLYNVACGDAIGVKTMYTGDSTVNQGQSNSLLKPAKHLQLHPTVEFDGLEEVDVDLLDNLETEDINFLMMDCQGYEGHVLRGAAETLKKIDVVYTEINFDEVYENCVKADELDEMLNEFKRVETGPKVGGMWSDSLYIRKSLLNE